jgi:hypothetical protein
MRSLRRLVFVLAATTMLVGGARAQPPRFSFTDVNPGWMDVELLLQNASVLKECKVDDRQALNARKAFVAPLARYTQDLQQVFNLPQEKQRPRQLELLDRYQEAQYQALAKTLKPDQLKRLKQIQIQVAGVDAFAQPWVQKELGLTGEQKDKMEAIGKEFAEARRKEEAQVKETLKNVLDANQLDQLKLIQGWGAAMDAATQPWAQKMLRLTGEQKDKIKGVANALAELKKRDDVLVQETMNKATDMLSSEQRKKWDDVAGKPYHLEVKIDN